MCLQRKPTAVFPAHWFEPSARAPATNESPKPNAMQPSRRRRLWELGGAAACPVLGVCLALAQQRQLLCKCGIDVQGRSDYELHQIGVSECRQRSRFAEQVQKLLDANFTQALRQVQGLAGADELRSCWQEQKQQPVWSGLMWAVLTHPSCNMTLEQEVLGDVHMMQHQVGMVTRVEQKRWDDLAQMAQRLEQEKRQWQERWEAQQREGQQRQHAWRQENAGLRQQIAQLEEQRRQTQLQLDAVTETLAGQATLQVLQLEQQRLLEENQVLARALKAATRAQAVTAKTNDAATTSPAATAPLSVCVAEQAALLGRQVAGAPQPRRVACVGGRTSRLAAYRAVVEAHGLELLHHDGGEEDSLGQLPTTLAAADLVLCQVGCISHNAYWRVKEHCKRHGKPCVFIESASRSALERAITGIMGAEPAQS